eukprot:CAMPEP_0113821270 /NCGR_PEP_ID=MMETSP0328-20130328/1654_1 /TAXON_ID=39455 /ORGANISM="Alexandrium minutum" /LENGTH=352 /DNA_ID=CAMNT_0000789201 /DNA_START=244 /DNA_END=1299 /DNA_ORIENTATION=+ /assembly_acc=CAM_ASM_000350
MRRVNSLQALGCLGHRVAHAVLAVATLAAWSCANVPATRAVLAAREVVPVAVLATGTARPDADVAATRGVRAAPELGPVAVGALDALGHLVRAERLRGHSVLVALAVGAALAAGRRTGVPAASVVLGASEVEAQRVLTTGAAGRDADVAATGGALAAHEGLPVAVRALHAVVDVCGALRAWRHGVLVAQGVGAALAARGRASAAATGVASRTSKAVAVLVLAACAAGGHADVPATRGSGRALEEQAVGVLADPCARLVAELPERPRQPIWVVDAVRLHRHLQQRRLLSLCCAPVTAASGRGRAWLGQQRHGDRRPEEESSQDPGRGHLLAYSSGRGGDGGDPSLNLLEPKWL